MGNLRRMHPVGTGSLIDGFAPFECCECHTGFELRTVLLPLCRHLPSPHLHLLLTQHSILSTCPVFGVHYNYFAIHHWEGEMTNHEAEELVWVPFDEVETFDLDVDRIAIGEYLRVYQAQRQHSAPPGDAAPAHAALQPGDKVIWWKRIAGGDYVSPVQATVLALTAKRVKIEAEDDGEMVIRHVPRESLQRQG